jgi:hypothetical protein
MLHPDFPVISGVYQMTSDWSVDLPGEFNRRIEEGSLVIWRPGITLWIAVWDNPQDTTPQELLAELRDDIGPGAYDIVSESSRGIERLRYRLEETSGDKRVAAFYSFAVGESGHVQMSVYFDDERTVAVADQLWRSLRETTAP